MRDRNLFEFFVKRKNKSHKGDYGKFLIVSGSKDRAGGPALSALSALRTGIDIAAIFAPKYISNVIRSFSPNIISVYEYESERLDKKAFSEFESLYKRFDSCLIAIDPKRNLKDRKVKSTLSSMVGLLKEDNKNFVLDAGSLSVLTPKDVADSNCIVTPHSGEYEIFLKNYKLKYNPEFCILLKGHEDMIYYDNKKAVNKTGNPGMTVAGTGDVLSGILGAVLTQTDDIFLGGCAAAYISGLAGNLAYKKYGYSLLPTDVIESIPNAIQKSKKAILWQEKL